MLLFSIFQASFLEIYNEEIRDLLQSDPNLKYEIKMSDSKGSDVHVTNLKVEEVTNEDQIEVIIKKARKNRAWAKTLSNERSSRSHSVFMLKIEGFNSATSESCCGTLNLVSRHIIIIVTTFKDPILNFDSYQLPG